MAGSLEVKAQIVETSKGGCEMPALRHYKHEVQPEQKHEQGSPGTKLATHRLLLVMSSRHIKKKKKKYIQLRRT